MQAIFDDPFDDGARNPAWTDEANNGTIVEAGDVLTLAIANAVDGKWLLAGVENCPFAKLSPTVDRLIVMTKLNTYVVNDETNAGLLIGSTTNIPDNAGGYCFSFYRVRHDPAAGLSVTDVGVAGAVAHVAEITLPIWLRMVISGSGVGATIDFDYSTDGINWTTLYTKTGLTWSLIGLHAKNWGALNAISAPFEFFTIDHLPSDFLSVGQQPLNKFEIFVTPNWLDITDLIGENYLESFSVSLGGATMTPNPVAGKWSARIFNQDGIFHPQHPTSAYKDYLTTERLTRISVGATYGGVDTYWPRIIGYMDVPKFSAPDYRVNISGGDYMKRLRDTELKFGTTGDNYWGEHEHFTSIASDGLTGVEIYTQVDAMDTADDGTPPYDNVTNWVATNCDFDSFDVGAGGIFFVGRVSNRTTSPVRLNNPNVGAAVQGEMYQVKFKHRIVGGTGINAIRPKIIQASGVCVSVTYFPTDTWKEETFYFTALDTGVIEWRFQLFPTNVDLRLDQFSIFHYIPYWQQNYPITDANSKGPYFVTIDGDPVWQGEVDEGWYYTKDAEAGPDPPAHDARIVYFDPNKTVAGGLDLIVYYFMQQEAEDVVARLLFKAGLYTSEANALAAIIAHLDYIDPNVQIDNVWFESGTTCLNAIKKVCERCDYRFYFDYDGEPVFRPKPTAGAADFIFTSPAQIASISTYQAQSEIKNKVVIKGMKRAEPVEKEETVPSYWKGEDSDAASITAYGERTLTINNHLFQDQATIDAMCTTLKDEYKNPRWYSDLRVLFNPVPLELGDNIQWELRLSPVLNVTQTGIIRDIKLDNFSAIYKCEIT